MSKNIIQEQKMANWYLDKVIEMLVHKGYCPIKNEYFEYIKQILPGKLRGYVLFHCDIKSRLIFITYQKFHKK